MKKQTIKLCLFFMVLFLSFNIVNAQYDGGIYWTYDDYVNNKLEVKGKVYGGSYNSISSMTLIFEKENGEKEKVNISKAYAVKDTRGFLWKPDQKGLFLVLVKGNICLYIKAVDILKPVVGEGINCNKKGKPDINQGTDYYVSKGINGEIEKATGTKKLKELLAGSESALAILKNNLAFELGFDATAEYNKQNPSEGDYLYPKCK